jgi:non-reducing end alpha-L-arabinofuranosidase
VPSASALVPGSVIQLRATTPVSAGDCVRHKDGRALLSPIGKSSVTFDIQDATWIVRVGLADRAGVSFESRNYSGGFLRHRNGAVYQEPNDGTEQFALDATFLAEPGKNGQGVSLAALNYPSRFVRHYGGEVFIAAEGGAEPWESESSWADDVSWIASPAWVL